MFFISAKPIWAKNREDELNLNLMFRTVFEGSETCSLNITASCIYRIWINGEFLGYGPARAAHGYFRVDSYILNNLSDNNTVEIEVAGYNTKSFYTLNQPSFVLAEITRDGKTVKTTGNNNDFDCFETDRVQKVLRFSYQRPFTEYYVNGVERSKLETSVVKGGKLLERRIGYPLFNNTEAVALEQGYISVDESKKIVPENRINTTLPLKIYQLNELERCPVDDLNSYIYSIGELNDGSLSGNEYRVYKFNNSETGFLGLNVSVETNSKIYIIFDEVDYRTNPEEGKPLNIDYFRNDTYNVIGYELIPGNYDLLSFEAYTANYVKVIVASGCINVKSVYLKRYENNFFEGYKFEHPNKKIEQIVVAAARTYAHNSVDIPTDCPSRERAGWLCDSYFSSRSEKFFTGKNDVERNFLENYALAPKLENIPEGMIAMCYPADFETEIFIPNWSLWYLVELRDYLARSNDTSMIELSRGKVEGLLDYFSRFENSDGLLEDLENWVFVEWSMANDAEYIKGVNYPSNMLYAAALDAVSELYSDYAYLKEKAERIRDIIRIQSFNGEFFEDNSIRINGKLTATGHTTETCQYYAFYFKVADAENYLQLYETMLNKFGPNRDAKTVYPTVYSSNAFIGNYLRLEILLRHGLKEKLMQESVDYFYKMAITTGTLWEHDMIFASLNHGFASYIACLIAKCDE